MASESDAEECVYVVYCDCNNEETETSNQWSRRTTTTVTAAQYSLHAWWEISWKESAGAQSIQWSYLETRQL
jgi:hypothetical protein